MPGEDLWVIIPAYNEAKRIEKVVKRVRRYTNHIVVVDDGSGDGSAAVAQKSGAVVLKHIVNLGKGAAVKTGADYACEKGARSLVFMDGDGQNDPADIPRFVSTLKGADIVFSKRKLDRKMPFLFRFGNWGMTWLINLLYHVSIQDSQGGFRAMTAKAYRSIRWKARDYSMESEMIANVGKQHLRYREIDIKTIYADKYKGTTVLDGIRIVLNMLWWKITR